MDFSDSEAAEHLRDYIERDLSGKIRGKSGGKPGTGTCEETDILAAIPAAADLLLASEHLVKATVSALADGWPG